jgi:hypothetical protein
MCEFSLSFAPCGSAATDGFGGKSLRSPYRPNTHIPALASIALASSIERWRDLELSGFCLTLLNDRPEWSSGSALAAAAKNLVRASWLVMMVRPTFEYSSLTPLMPMRHHRHSVEMAGRLPLITGITLVASVKDISSLVSSSSAIVVFTKILFDHGILKLRIDVNRK